MTRTLTVIGLFLAISISLALFQLKYRVQDLESDIRTLEQTIRSEREAIHVLKAEWSHLNDPSLLRVLAARHLDLAPMRTTQLARWDDVATANDTKPDPPTLTMTTVAALRMPSAKPRRPEAWLTRTRAALDSVDPGDRR